MTKYLGLDASTQSISALIIDTDRGRVVVDESLPFAALSAYRCPQGFLDHPDPRIKHSDPLMWVAALDVLLDRLWKQGIDFSQVVGIGGAGQQHGSVYLGLPIKEAPAWHVNQSLAQQIEPLLSRRTAPIWMDSATSEECREIATTAGGDENVIRVTGSRVIERFTGPQIRKFWKEDPAAYEKTVEIHLVSSFLASVLTGTSAPIDYGDGAGMNLLDLASLAWSVPLLAATAPSLGARLPKPVPAATVIGTIAPYFVQKYGFAVDTPIVAFTGDNPSSLVGMGATTPGTAVISLGTSDTVFAAMEHPHTDPGGFGHVFGNPAGGFLSLICFANGSLAREQVAARCGLDWAAFERAILQETVPGNGGAMLLPYFVPEITPKITAQGPFLFGDESFRAWGDGARAARAVVEAQALSMQRHAAWIGPAPTTLLATGGASANLGILKIIADVMQAEVKRLDVKNASALGAALRAAHTIGKIEWTTLFQHFTQPDPRVAIVPNPATREIYQALAARFAAEVDRVSGGTL